MNYSILCLAISVEECVADYLLINKCVKTKIFAEKIGEEWIVKRGVTREFLTDFLINKEDLLKKTRNVNKNYVKKCSEVLNKYLNKKYNEGYLNKIKNYIWRNKINKNILNVRELFTENNKDYLIISDKYQKKLEEQSICLTKFLLKHFGFDGHYYEEKVPELIEKGEDAIKDYFKIPRENEFYAFRGEFVGDYYDILYNHEFGEGQIKELNECIKILNIKNCDHNENNFDALYNRFDPTQFYYKKLPKFEGTFEIEKNNDIQCSICLYNIEEGQLAQLTPCGHIFHVNCFWTWYKDHHNCPFCRKAFLIKFIEFLDPPKNKTKNKRVLIKEIFEKQKLTKD
uniref:RING-type domain-containing protein n=1 Tax=Meloidogyne enterolobii TaxID=390850 RepID=A0A6V7W9P0_MELEN|nr:unnamed protein product [Meloidogyne enterolobii]